VAIGTSFHNSKRAQLGNSTRAVERSVEGGKCPKRAPTAPDLFFSNVYDNYILGSAEGHFSAKLSTALNSNQPSAKE